MKVETNLRPRACYLGRETQLAVMGDEWALRPVSDGRDAKYYGCSELQGEQFAAPQGVSDLGSVLAINAFATLEWRFSIWCP